MLLEDNAQIIFKKQQKLLVVTVEKANIASHNVVGEHNSEQHSVSCNTGIFQQPQTLYNWIAITTILTAAIETFFPWFTGEMDALLLPSWHINMPVMTTSIGICTLL